jgi:histidinol phosphatase-like PHP family hydrolase
MTPDLYRRALRQGPWQAFAITDHAFSLALPDDETPWPWQWYYAPERLWAHRAFREEKTAQYLERTGAICDGKRLFRGLEVEVAWDGTLSMESLLWPYLDVVIGSIHYLPDAPGGRYDAHLMQLSTLLSYPIDILGHPFRALVSDDPIPEEIIDETLKLAKDASAAIEINAHKIDLDTDATVLRKAVAMGCTIAFGLDAHHRHELDLHTYFDQVVRASGVDPAAIRHFRPIRKSAKPRTLVR